MAMNGFSLTVSWLLAQTAGYCSCAVFSEVAKSAVSGRKKCSLEEGSYSVS